MLHYFVENSSWIILSVLLLAALAYFSINKGEQLYPFNKQNTIGLRGLMAVLLIFCHTGHEFSESSPIKFCADFGAPIVSVFLFLSGYGLVKSFDINHDKFMCNFISRNLIKLLPVLITATIASLILRWLLLHQSPIIAISGYAHGKPPLEHSWFMYLLLILYIMFYFCFLNKTRPLISVIMLFGLIALLYVGFRVLGWGSYWYLSLFAFNAGNFVAMYEKPILNYVNDHKVICTLSVLVIMTICGISGIRNGIVFIPISLYLLIVIFGGIRGKLWSYLGSYAYEIYLAHGICLPLIFALEFDWAITLCLNVVSSIILAFPLKKIAETFIIHLYSIPAISR